MIVVHGVGNPKKGETIRRLGTQLSRLSAQISVKQTGVVSTDYVVAETPSNHGETDHYEIPICRFKNDRSDVSLAEVFWGDLSHVQPGIIGLFRGLFDFLYGLPAVIEQLIKEATLSRDASSNRWYSLFSHWAVLTIIGPILALHIYILILISLSLASFYLKEAIGSPDNSKSTLIGAIVLTSGSIAVPLFFGELRSWFQRQDWSTLTVTWLFYLSLFGTVLFLIIPLSKVFVLFGLPSIASDHYFAHLSNFIPDLTAGLWLFAISLNVASIIFLFRCLAVCEFEQRRPYKTAFIVTQLCFLLWAMLLASIVFLTIYLLPDSFLEYLKKSRNFDLRTQYRDSLPWVLIPNTGIIIVAGIFLHTWFKRGHTTRPDESVRLVFPETIFTGLLLFTFAYLLFLPYLMKLLINDTSNANWVATVTMIIQFTLILVFSVFHKRITIGTDIGLDVSNYWRERNKATYAEASTILHRADTAIRSRLRVGAASRSLQCKPTENQKISDGKIDFGDDIQHYYKRHQMRVRFVAVYDRLLAQNPDAIVVVAHSQGSMITIDGLLQCSKNAHLKPALKITHLVTMGSPYEHLYQHYFPEHHDIDPLKGHDPLASWLNIYRSNDFVGTSLDEIQNIENIPVGPRGHTNYWTDKEVLDIFVNHLEKNHIDI